MEIEAQDRVSDTIAFLLARVHEDVDAAKLIADSAEKVAELLMGMTDFAYAQIKIFADLAGTTPEHFLKTMALGAKMYGPEFGNR